MKGEVVSEGMITAAVKAWPLRWKEADEETQRRQARQVLRAALAVQAEEHRQATEETAAGGPRLIASQLLSLARRIAAEPTQIEDAHICEQAAALLTQPNKTNPKGQPEDYHYLCLHCGVITPVAEWTEWKYDYEGEHGPEGALISNPPGESDPLVKCPRCGELHGDCYQGAGVEDGTKAELEAYRRNTVSADEHESWREFWAEKHTQQSKGQPEPSCENCGGAGSYVTGDAPHDESHTYRETCPDCSETGKGQPETDQLADVVRRLTSNSAIDAGCHAFEQVAEVHDPEYEFTESWLRRAFRAALDAAIADQALAQPETEGLDRVGELKRRFTARRADLIEMREEWEREPGGKEEGRLNNVYGHRCDAIATFIVEELLPALNEAINHVETDHDDGEAGQ